VCTFLYTNQNNNKQTRNWIVCKLWNGTTNCSTIYIILFCFL